MRPLAILALALFTGAFYLPPIPSTWTHRQLPSCYYERTWLGRAIIAPSKPMDFATRARACFVDRGGYLLQPIDPAKFVMLQEWPRDAQ